MVKQETKGYMNFVFSDKAGLMIFTYDFVEDWEKFMGQRPVYDLMDGKEFVEHIECGGIINEDGHIAEIFVDGYISNLGLFHNGFFDGYFLMDRNTFLDICENHEVKVNWVNK